MGGLGSGPFPRGPGPAPADWKGIDAILSESAKKPQKKTSIGGQALIEGVMMRGPYVSAMAIHKSDGEITVETWETGSRRWYYGIPIVRGIVNFVVMLVTGYRCLMRSAELSGIAEEEEPSKFDLWVDEHLGDKAVGVFNFLVTVIAMVLAIGLFLLLPSALIKLAEGALLHLPNFVMTLSEGILKIAIFVGYLFLVTRMKDIHRVFEYHGAEHKTIACYEAGDELTPENAKKYIRFHPRCGTSFLLIVLIVSILVNSVLTWDSLWIRVVLKLLMLPLVVGLSYEVIRFAGRNDNALTRAVSAPGLWLQRLTTFEPDLTQLEVAIAAMKPCIPENKNDDLYGA